MHGDNATWCHNVVQIFQFAFQRVVVMVRINYAEINRDIESFWQAEHFPLRNAVVRYSLHVHEIRNHFVRKRHGQEIARIGQGNQLVLHSRPQAVRQQLHDVGSGPETDLKNELGSKLINDVLDFYAAPELVMRFSILQHDLNLFFRQFVQGAAFP